MVMVVLVMVVVIAEMGEGLNHAQLRSDVGFTKIFRLKHYHPSPKVGRTKQKKGQRVMF